MICGVDERQAAKLARAILIYSLSMMVSGMATAIIIYILLCKPPHMCFFSFIWVCSFLIYERNIFYNIFF